MWFSVVCTLIDNDTRQHSGQNLFWTHEVRIDVSFLCVSRPVIDHKFRHHIVKVAVNPRSDSRVDPQTTLTML